MQNITTYISEKFRVQNDREYYVDLWDDKYINSIKNIEDIGEQLELFRFLFDDVFKYIEKDGPYVQFVWMAGLKKPFENSTLLRDSRLEIYTTKSSNFAVKTTFDVIQSKGRKTKWLKSCDSLKDAILYIRSLIKSENNK